MKSKRVNWAVLGIFVVLAVTTGFYYQTFTTSSYEALIFNQVTGVTISPVPTSANPGTNCRAANTACSIQNVGAGEHLVTYCITGGTVNAIAIELEGSNDIGNPPTNWMQISNQDTTLTGTAGCGVLEAAGYFQYLRINLSNFNGVNPVLTAWYAGVGTAIPGGGLVAGNKTSQPVTTVPAFAFSQTALQTTPSTVCTTACTIFSADVYNPNASPVFFLITHVQQSSGGAIGTVVFGIPANAGRNIPFGPGLSAGLGGSSVITCATNVNGSGDPAVGCVETIEIKPFQAINAQVNSAGTPISIKTQQPN